MRSRLCEACYRGSPAVNCYACAARGLTVREWKTADGELRWWDLVTWQDVVIGCGQWVFSLALLPSILGTEKPEVLTCALTAPLLFAFCVTYVTLKMRIAAVATLTCGVLWAVLLFQQLGVL